LHKERKRAKGERVDCGAAVATMQEKGRLRDGIKENLNTNRNQNEVHAELDSRLKFMN